MYNASVIQRRESVLRCDSTVPSQYINVFQNDSSVRKRRLRRRFSMRCSSFHRRSSIRCLLSKGRAVLTADPTDLETLLTTRIGAATDLAIVLRLLSLSEDVMVDYTWVLKMFVATSANSMCTLWQQHFFESFSFNHTHCVVSGGRQTKQSPLRRQRCSQIMCPQLLSEGGTFCVLRDNG